MLFMFKRYVPITSIWNRILSKEHRSCHMIASNRSNFPQNTVFKTLKNSTITVSIRFLFYQLDNHFIPQRSSVCLNKSPKTILDFQRPFFPDFRRLYKNKDVAHSKQPLYIYISETYYNCTKFDLLIHTAASNTKMPSASVYEISKIRAQVIVFFSQVSKQPKTSMQQLFILYIFLERNFLRLKSLLFFGNSCSRLGRIKIIPVDNFCKKQFLTVHYLLNLRSLPFFKGTSKGVQVQPPPLDFPRLKEAEIVRSSHVSRSSMF